MSDVNPRVAALFSFMEEVARVVDDNVYEVSVESGEVMLRGHPENCSEISFSVTTDCGLINQVWTSDGYMTGRTGYDDQPVEEIEAFISELVAIGRQYLIQRPVPTGFFFPKIVVHMPHRQETLRRTLFEDLGRILSLRWIREVRAR
ncbi:hypothetical protein [Changpingibacter yushuensis]|uniref:hypothetical protein n=1 Tax=Changpingibacter yushuensis TaxID=2758440 RepID=UPI0015F4DA3B|nr:hypothetical protein [Changpingibacter yushuensis]